MRLAASAQLRAAGLAAEISTVQASFIMENMRMTERCETPNLSRDAFAGHRDCNATLEAEKAALAARIQVPLTSFSSLTWVYNPCMESCRVEGPDAELSSLEAESQTFRCYSLLSCGTEPMRQHSRIRVLKELPGNF